MLFSKEAYLHPHAEVAISTVTAATADAISLIKCYAMYLFVLFYVF